MAPQILIVDDEPNIVIALELLLEQAGYTIAVAYSGAEALAQIADLRPAVVLLDVMLPDINGFDILQRVRQNLAWQQMAIIMVTAKARDVEVAKGLALGANAYVTKPFSTRDLLAQVRRCLDIASEHETHTD